MLNPIRSALWLAVDLIDLEMSTGSSLDPAKLELARNHLYEAVYLTRELEPVKLNPPPIKVSRISSRGAA